MCFGGGGSSKADTPAPPPAPPPVLTQSAPLGYKSTSDYEDEKKKKDASRRKATGTKDFRTRAGSSGLSIGGAKREGSTRSGALNI